MMNKIYVDIVNDPSVSNKTNELTGKKMKVF